MYFIHVQGLKKKRMNICNQSAMKLSCRYEKSFEFGKIGRKSM